MMPSAFRFVVLFVLAAGQLACGGNGLAADAAVNHAAVNAAAGEATALAGALESVTTSDLRRHAEFLAADTLEGREAGSRGGQAAGGYLIDQLRQMKLHGGAADGAFHQPVPTGGRNILAIVPGGDEQLRRQVIVVGAHYDHVGYGNRGNSYGPTGLIHNGADDNASGTSGLLEIAEALARLPQPPRRTILLAWWDGEENGLLGSKHWMANPTVAKDRLAMMFNADMIGRLRSDRVEVTGVRTAPGLRRWISGWNNAPALSLDFQWEIKSNSDHHPFYEAGVPIVMLHTGLHEDYHRPSDDIERLSVDGMQRVTRLMLSLVLDAANADALPAFRSSARQEASENARRQFERSLAAPSPRLGVTWDAADTSGGLLVKRVDDGSPADRAGVREGDRLLALNDAPWQSEDEFRTLVWAADNPARMLVRRGDREAPVIVPIELAGSPVRLGMAWRIDEAEPRTVFVVQVYGGSPTDRAGVKLGDRIDAAAGREFTDSDELLRIVGEQSVAFELKIERNGAIQSLTVGPLAKFPAAPRATEP
ncbi:MAG: M20/M25/M40 family metallo-hydrolase [Pirellulales bacterium]